MDYFTNLSFSADVRIRELHIKIYEKIRATMENNARKPKAEWEAFHLLEYAKTIRPQEEEENERERLDAILADRGFDNGFKHLQNRSRQGYTMRNSDFVFKALAEFQDIPLLVCFLNFLEFCRDTARPLSVFSDKKSISITIDELILDIKKHLDKQFQEAAPSPVQPNFTIPEARTDEHFYYANPIIKVIGRKKEQKRLFDFLNCDLNIAWFQLAGVAGQGKSRLAFEFINDAIELGWSAGLFQEDDIEYFQGQWQTWQPDRPQLFVFDYVVGREDEIKSILRPLLYRQGEFLHNIRILLVERQRWDKGLTFQNEVHNSSNKDEFAFADTSESEAEWFLNLGKDKKDRVNDQVLKRLEKTRFDNGVEELKKLDENDLVNIVKQIAKHTSGKELTVSQSDIKKTLNRIDLLGRPLYAYFLGQELAHGVNTQGWSSQTLLDKTLDRERDKWWGMAFSNNPPEPEEDILASRLALLATMTSGINCEKAHKSGLIPKSDPKARRQALALTGAGISTKSVGFKGTTQNIPAMQPDLLGEWYVIKSFKAGLPLEELTAVAWRYAPEKMSSFMQRLFQDFQEHTVAKSMIDCVEGDQVDINAIAKSAKVLVTLLNRARLTVPQKLIQALHNEAEKGDPRSNGVLGMCYEFGTGVEKDSYKAVEYYEKASKLDDLTAMTNLGRCYKFGSGVEKDSHKAFDYFRQAAKAGDTNAMIKLGDCYQDGTGVEKNGRKAVDYYEQAAEAGNTNAMIKLGNCYREATSVKMDGLKAFAFYKQAAEAGNMDATIFLGGCYQDGTGVKKDSQKAVEYFEQAAEAGYKFAMVHLGNIYLLGIGVKKDFNKALDYYEQAVAAGDTEAMMLLGNCYQNGTGVEKDSEKAFKYHLQAAELGNTEVLEALGWYYENGVSVEKDIVKAIEYYEQAAKEGFTEVLARLGWFYENGVGVEKDTLKAVEYYDQAAKAGNTDVMTNLGWYYENGVGVEKDIGKAFEYYEQAAEAGHASAMDSLGFCYETGIGVEKDIDKAVEYYRKAADAGDLDAMNKLGFCYGDGFGVKKDVYKAVEYYRKAADMGHDFAMNNLGRYYQNGIGVNKDSHKAVEYYRKAAEMGHASAMNNLGFCYDNGIGVEKDSHTAIEYYKKAADADDLDAIFNLALCYDDGNGVEKNSQKAVKYYQMADEMGDASSMNSLGLHYQNGIGVEKDSHKAIEYYRKAADAGDLDAIANLGFCFKHGIGVEQNIKKALEYYQKSADAGHARAMNNLGLCYMNGIGVEKNIIEAVDYFCKATDKGDVHAMNNLGACYENGVGVNKDIDKAIDYYSQSVESGNIIASQNLINLQFALNFLNGDNDRCAVDQNWAEKQAANLLNSDWPDTKLRNMEWRLPSSEETIQILSCFHQALRTVDILDDLGNDQCKRIRITSLSFYPGYSMADIEFYRSEKAESRFCSVLVGLNAATPLNRQTEINQSINKTLLNFKENNALEDYLYFYYEFNHDDEDSFHIVSNLNDIGSLMISGKILPKSIEQALFPIRHLDGELKADGWERFEACMISSNAFFTSTFKVFLDGKLEMEDQEKVAENLPILQCKYNGIFRSSLQQKM